MKNLKSQECYVLEKKMDGPFNSNINKYAIIRREFGRQVEILGRSSLIGHRIIFEVLNEKLERSR